MARLHRTQIYLDSEQLQELRFQSQRLHASVASVIRTAIGRFLKARRSVLQRRRDPIHRLVGAFASRTHDLAQHHDHYLYGSAKKKLG
ncbi:MAG: hypothetical protein HYZ73_03405 [Elusimicrobia bacterium]|nr:hypothetical protein [Elusimicrobiota bacterium]